jgi:hypothetical protein
MIVKKAGCVARGKIKIPPQNNLEKLGFIILTK